MRIVHVFGGVLVLVVAALLWNQPTQGQEQPSKAIRAGWEYKVVHVRSLVSLDGVKLNVFKPDPNQLQSLTDSLEVNLNALGADGWELCLEINGGVIFKRPK